MISLQKWIAHFLLIWNNEEIHRNKHFSSKIFLVHRCKSGIAIFAWRVTQTTQTAHTLSLDRLSRPIMSRHAMLRFHVMFFDWHLTATCCIQGLSFRTFKEIFNFKYLFLKILHFLFKGSLNIPEFRCLLIGRVQYLYTTEHAWKISQIIGVNRSL